MIIMPLQAFGLGDVIFSMELVRQRANGRPILWPVQEQFVWGLQDAYPDVDFIDEKIIAPAIFNVKQETTIRHPFGNICILPIRWSDSIMQVPYKQVMRAKYDMYKMDWRMWRNSMYKRNISKERKLYLDVLGIRMDEKYCLVNQNFTSNMGRQAAITPQTDLRIIHVRPIEGYSLFDWSYVIEKAAEIHTVGTSINYIIELLDISAPHVTLYKRLPQETHYDNYNYILTKHKYIFT